MFSSKNFAFVALLLAIMMLISAVFVRAESSTDEETAEAPAAAAAAAAASNDIVDDLDIDIDLDDDTDESSDTPVLANSRYEVNLNADEDALWDDDVDHFPKSDDVESADGENADDEDDEEEKSRVIHYTADQLTEALEEVDNLVLAFIDSTRNCHSCEAAEALFDTVSEEEQFKAVVFGIFDCHEEPAFCTRYNVVDYPDIRLFNEGLGIYSYNERTLARDLFEAYIIKYTGPKATTLKTAEEVTEFLASHFSSVVHLRTEDSKKATGSFLRTAAELFDDVTFAIVEPEAQTEEILARFEAEPGSILYVTVPPSEHSEGTMNVNAYDNTVVSRSRLRSWIRKSHTLPVYNFSTQSFSDVLGHGLPIAVMHVPFSNEELRKEIVSTMWKLNELFQKKIILAYIDSDREDPMSLKRNGLFDHSAPGLLIHSNNRGLYVYPQNSEYTLEAIESYFQRFLKNRLVRHSIREPLPANNPEYVNGVLTVVYDNFRSTVFNEDKDVMILFYLPESICEPCKTILPIYEEVAQRLAKWNDAITVGKVNMYYNEVLPGVHVSNFPTIKYFPSDLKTKEFTFNAQRTIEQLMQFVYDSSSFDLRAEEAAEHGETVEDKEPIVLQQEIE